MTIRKGDIIVSGNGANAGANKDLSNLSEEGLLKLIPPVATPNTSGIVKPDGTTITITEDGTISSVGGDSFSGDYNDLINTPVIPPAYNLPTASTSTLGGVKVDGTTITIANGIISAVDTSGWTYSGSAKNGYLKHTKSGLIIQCITINTTVSCASVGNFNGTTIYGGSKNVSYLTPFSSIHVIVGFTSTSVSGVGDATLGSVTANNVSTFTVSINSSAAGTATVKGYVIAMGI